MKCAFLFSCVALCFLSIPICWAEEVFVPAFTAYMLPDPAAAEINEGTGVTHWNDVSQSVNWYGKFNAAGELHAKVRLRLPRDVQSKFKLTVCGQTHLATATGLGPELTAIVDFGTFKVDSAGYKRFSLESANEVGGQIGDIESLALDGPAMDGGPAIEGEPAMKAAHFNLEERRNAASVHLAYQVPAGADAAAFYCEVTAIEDPVATFYMACGWHRGYFGMQVNSPTERRIIFSVWDSGDEAIDRKNVDEKNRVTLMGKGDGVYSGDFGNEGTGGHSHLKYLWKTGDKQRFVVTAEPVEDTFTIFTGYWFHPDQQKWMLISSWKAPKEGGLLKGLHSFSENFSGENGHLLRKALYGNQWIRSSDRHWTEVTAATFSHDPTGSTARFDRFMGIENGQFFLSHGGFSDGFTTYGDRFVRDPIGKSPTDIELPAIRQK